MNGHVFISYSHENQVYVSKLVDDLNEHGFAAWADDRIDCGDSWWRTVVRALRTCAAVVVVMTPEAEDSEWVQREIMVALRERKPIFPLLLRGQGLTLLITTQYLDVTGDRMPPESFYTRLDATVFSPSPVPVPTDPEMILIPAGDFRMGSKPRNRYAPDNEKPQYALYLSDYYIAKTPVTNAQYAAFVQDTDARRPTDWGSEYGRPPRGKETHPVVYVSWYEARDYCQWLSRMTRKQYRLPSEAEWEKAARSTDGRTFPWGSRWAKQRCNSVDEDLDGTTPVGSYLKGASPYGLLDMAGNVWEWTRSLWGEDSLDPDFEYPYDPGDGRENVRANEEVRRVLRGGSFADTAGDIRCTARHARLPCHRFRTVGFRVAARDL